MESELIREINVREQAEAKYRTLVELAPMGIVIADKDGLILFTNSYASRGLGSQDSNELVGKSVLDFMEPEIRELSRQRQEWMLKEWKPAPAIEIHGERMDGTSGCAEIHSAPIFYNGAPSIMIVGLDVTERKKAEDRLRSSLKEKEVLLREIHHRVKNNLQLVASMLELQAQSIRDDKVIASIKEARNRVWAMAAAHETLYQSGNLAEISSRHYLSRLLMYLVSMMDPLSAQVELVHDIQDMPMKIDTAVNCGLILSELIANCYKHAFRGIADGKIEVFLRSSQENWTELTIRDNGTGIPENKNIPEMKTFGLNLVSMLVQELRGEMCLRRIGGTEFTITFPSTGK